ncbi:MAG: bL21 family ribosomal protein, partial [Monoglobales bacterium]
VTVEAELIESVKGNKVRIFKYKPKKGYHKRQGHRQPLDKIEIKAIKTAKPRAPKAEAEATAEEN